MSEELEEQTEEQETEEIQEDATVKETVHELSRPVVIDLEALMKPISGDQPSGDYMRYSGIYDEISEARRQDEDLEQGDWEFELKVADYKKTIELAETTLQTETKDLQIAAWLAEALVMEHGFAGLRDALKLITGLEENFWETLYPEIDEGDQEGRANALAWMDRETALAIKKAPITEGDGQSFFGYEDSKQFDIPDSYESFDTEERKKYAEMAERVKKQNRITKKEWDKAVSVSKRAFYEELDVAIQECIEAFNAMVEVTDSKFDPNQVPSLTNVKKSLDEIRMQTNKLLEQKRMEEPVASDFSDESENTVDGEMTASVGGSNSGGGGGNGFSVSGAINSRREALNRLSEIAHFFSQTEPHSPVAHLVNRAVRWGEMPLDNWLKEVIKDDNVLGQIRETLGLNFVESSDDGDEAVEETSSSNDDW